LVIIPSGEKEMLITVYHGVNVGTAKDKGAIDVTP
jgi:hypothetical protein